MEVEDYFGNHSGAAAARAVADTIVEQCNAWLWDNKSDDHYVTQLNMDGTVQVSHTFCDTYLTAML